MIHTSTKEKKKTISVKNVGKLKLHKACLYEIILYYIEIGTTYANLYYCSDLDCLGRFYNDITRLQNQLIFTQ